jgi:hypothetical protein
MDSKEDRLCGDFRRQAWEEDLQTADPSDWLICQQLESACCLECYFLIFFILKAVSCAASGAGLTVWPFAQKLPTTTAKS